MRSAERAPDAAGAARAVRTRLLWVILTGLVVGAAAGLAWAPWLSVGVLLGALLFGLTVTWPLGVVTAMLAIGPLDLSFLTGGFKGLFGEIGGLDMNGIRLIFVSAGLGLVILTDRRYWKRLTSPPVRFFVLFLAFAAATLVVSEDRIEGLRLLLKLTWPLLFFLVVSGPDRTPREIDRMTDWLLYGAAAIVVLNPLFILRGDVLVELTGEVRLMGAGVHQNPFSFAMLVVVLISLGRFAVRGQLRYVALAAGAMIWIGLTLTRITFLAGVVSLGAVALYAALVRRNYRAAAIEAGVGIAIVLVFAPVMLRRTFGTIPTPGDLFEMARDPLVLYRSVNWSGREVFWGALALSWMSSPWVGHGLGSSSGLLKALFPPEMGTVAHNEYLRLGTDTGFLGLALFVAAMVEWVRVAASAGRHGGREVQEIALPALAVMISWGVIALTDNAFDYYAPFTQFAGFLVGGSLVAARRAEGALRHREPGEL